MENVKENNSVPGEVIGLPVSSIVYPLLISLYGETKKGKTYTGASFPNAILLDLPPVKMGFGKVEMDKAALTRTVGEGFRSLFSPQKRDSGIVWVPKIAGFDYKTQYVFIKSWKEFQEAIGKARVFSELMPEEQGKTWIVIDDTYRWRGLEVVNWQSKNSGKWPAAPQFGQITQQMQAELTDIQEFANVLLISRMVRDFDTGVYVAQVHPSGIDYLADASLEILTEIRDNKQVQVIKVHSNGHEKSWDNPNVCKEIVSPKSPSEILEKLKIPKTLW